MAYKRTVRSRIDLVGSEVVVTTATATGWAGAEPRGIIFCHGSGDDAAATQTRSDMRGLIRELAQFGTVQSADWGLQAWGNDACVAAVDDGVDRLVADWGVTEPVALVGVSMGALSVLNYAVRYPARVACVAAVIGLTDLGALYDTQPSYVAGINTAYGGSFDAGDRADHSPIAFVDDLPDDMPISLWTSSNDTLVLPAWHAAFRAARPQTSRFDLGAHGHGWGAGDDATIAEWVRRNQ